MKCRDGMLEYDVQAASLETALICSDKSRTIQSSKDECDINVIVERFGINVLAPVDLSKLQFGDASDITELREKLDIVKNAAEEFMKIPPLVRERFGNDPLRFVEECGDEKNLPKLRELGLANPIVEAPVAPVVAPTGAGA